MVYALAEKRCQNFATCTADDDGSDIEGRSAVNADLLELFEQGQVRTNPSLEVTFSREFGGFLSSSRLFAVEAVK